MNRKRLGILVVALFVSGAVLGIAQEPESELYPTAPAEMVESRGVTDLMWVASKLSIEDLRRLLEHKENVDPVAQDFYGNTAMHWVAFFATDPAVIDELLELGVVPDIVNSQGFTAFEIMQGNENLRGTEPYLSLLRAKLERRGSD